MNLMKRNIAILLSIISILFFFSPVSSSAAKKKALDPVKVVHEIREKLLMEKLDVYFTRRYSDNAAFYKDVLKYVRRTKRLIPKLVEMHFDDQIKEVMKAYFRSKRKKSAYPVWVRDEFKKPSDRMRRTYILKELPSSWHSVKPNTFEPSVSRMMISPVKGTSAQSKMYVSRRLTFTLPEYASANNFQVEIHIGNMTEAVQSLVNRGVELLGQIKGYHGLYYRAVVGFDPKQKKMILALTHIMGNEKLDNIRMMMAHSAKKPIRAKLYGDVAEMAENNRRSLKRILDNLDHPVESVIIGTRSKVRQWVLEHVIQGKGKRWHNVFDDGYWQFDQFVYENSRGKTVSLLLFANYNGSEILELVETLQFFKVKRMGFIGTAGLINPGKVGAEIGDVVMPVLYLNSAGKKVPVPLTKKILEVLKTGKYENVFAGGTLGNVTSLLRETDAWLKKAKGSFDLVDIEGALIAETIAKLSKKAHLFMGFRISDIPGDVHITDEKSIGKDSLHELLAGVFQVWKIGSFREVADKSVPAKRKRELKKAMAALKLREADFVKALWKVYTVYRGRARYYISFDFDEKFKDFTVDVAVIPTGKKRSKKKKLPSEINDSAGNLLVEVHEMGARPPNMCEIMDMRMLLEKPSPIHSAFRYFMVTRGIMVGRNYRGVATFKMLHGALGSCSAIMTRIIKQLK